MHEQPPLARRDVIATRLARGDSVVASLLATEFDVSEDAIRRDLRALAEAGACRRVYGGALPVTAASAPMKVRMQEDQASKHALGIAAVATIQRGEFLFLDTGSTNVELARVLPTNLDLTIATNSIDIAATILRRQDLRLLMIGGAVHPIVGGCVDSTAVLAVSRLNIDRCFIGACAVSTDSGVSVHDDADAAFKRALLHVSRHAIALVTSGKLETRAAHRIAGVDELDALIVEHDIKSRRLSDLKRAGASVLRAAATPSTPLR